MTLPDGTTIEVPMPTADDADDRAMRHRYRVCRADGVAECESLAEVAAELLGPPPGESVASSSSDRTS